MPRLSFSWKPTPQQNVFGIISRGFSSPTLEEVRTNEGSVNTEINAEVGNNFEMGYRVRSRDDRRVQVFYELAAFHYRLTNTITDYTSDRGTDLFNQPEKISADISGRWKDSYF